MCSADREIPSLFSTCWIILVGEVVMILRLWALYERSKFILGILLIFYAMEMILFFTIFVIYSKGSGNSDIGKLNRLVHTGTWLNIPLYWSCSGYYSSTLVYTLHVGKDFYGLGWSHRCCPDCSWHIDVSPHRYSIHQGVTTGVQGSEQIPP